MPTHLRRGLVTLAVASLALVPIVFGPRVLQADASGITPSDPEEVSAAAAVPGFGDNIAVAGGPGRATQVYARGLDDRLWVRDRPQGGLWNPWAAALVPPPVVGTQPAVVGGVGVGWQGGPGYLVATLGRYDNGTRAILTHFFNGVTRDPWTARTNGALLSAPAVGIQFSEHWIYGRGLDGALWQERYATGEWSSLGGVIVSAPAAVGTNEGGLFVFAQGQDNALWYRFRDTVGLWSAWTPLGGILTSGPAVVTSGSGNFDVFVRGQDGALWTAHFDGASLSGWMPLGGLITSAPTAMWPGPFELEVFARGGDGAIWTRHLVGGAWQPWESLGGNLQ